MKNRHNITNKPLTSKQKAFVRELVNNPKESATTAALKTYNTKDRATAAQIAHDNLIKPNIVTELAKYNNLVENTLINTINDYKDSDKLGERALATDTAKYIHDKIHGKATQQISSTTQSISFNIDLSQAMQELEEE